MGHPFERQLSHRKQVTILFFIVVFVRVNLCAGTFWMCWADFLAHFAMVEICKAHQVGSSIIPFDSSCDMGDDMPPSYHPPD
jgi:hypothetical protein